MPGFLFGKGCDMFDRFLQTDAPAATTLIRFAVGLVFFSEGVQKFLFPEALGVGRFAAIGLPAPQILAPFVGIVEITCGLLVVFGLLTRLAAIPLLVNITVAILTTKMPMLLNKGFWAMAHEARTDLAMLLGLLFLIFVGGGAISLDHRLESRIRDHRDGR